MLVHFSDDAQPILKCRLKEFDGHGKTSFA
jgi:hypothetical protein